MRGARFERTQRSSPATRDDECGDPRTSCELAGARHARARRSTRGRAPRRAVSVRASLKEEDELLGDLLANNAASFDGKLRTLVVGVSDFQGDEMLNHRNSTTSTLFKHRRWLDGYKVPGQFVTITDTDSGKSVRKPISVSPYKARTTAPNSDVSVVELLLDTMSDDGDENFFAAAQPPMRLRVTPVAGAGFENPLFSEFNLGSAIERGDAIVAFAGGARGIGPLRAVMEWPNVASHADKHPVTLFYLNCGDKPAPADPDDLDAVEQANGRGAAFVEQWDEWREGGAAVVPCFGPSSTTVCSQCSQPWSVASRVGRETRNRHGEGREARHRPAGGTEKEEVSAILRVPALQAVPKEQILALPGLVPRKSQT